MMRFYFSLMVFTLFLCTGCDKVPQIITAEAPLGTIKPMDLTETRTECFSVYL